MSAVVWEDPPETRGGRPPRPAVLTDEMRVELRANPGRWARIKDYPTAVAANSAKSRLRQDGWEFACRSDGGTGSVLYGRYVGGES